jgi:tungstate transport system ATP-binding protein
MSSAVVEPIRLPASPLLRGDVVCSVRGLVYEAGRKRLIDGIDLDLPRQSLTVVLGPNGAGKSLLLRQLHGLVTPTAGTVHWNGRPLGPDERRRQAMVFQRPVLLRRSVAANVRFALKLRKKSAGEEKVRELLRQVGLEAQADQAARLLSGGEQQRLAMARVLALEPEELFLDEPTASLDPASTAAIEEIVQAVYERGTKIVFVTHDLGQARRLADDVVFLNRGRLAEHSPAETFFDDPASEAARDYLAGRLILR